MKKKDDAEGKVINKKVDLEGKDVDKVDLDLKEFADNVFKD